MTGHPPDFEVAYRFYTPEEGGRENGQNYKQYRCDWSYEGDDISKTGIYTIWPEFLTDGGSPIEDGVAAAGHSGIATMWIVSHDMRVTRHRTRTQGKC